MDITPGLQLVSRRWRFVAGVALASAVVAFALSYLWSPRYTASTNVLIRARDARFLGQTGQDLSAQPAIVDQSLAKSLGDTNSSLVGSRTVAVAVVDDLKLDRREPDLSPIVQMRRAIKTVKDVLWNVLIHGYYATPSPREAAITQVQANLKATPVKDGFVLEIKAMADNPDDAAKIADSASKKLIQLARDRDKAESDRYRDFLKQQLEKDAADVRQAQQDIAGYKRDHGLSDIGEQLKLDAQGSVDSRKQLNDTDVQLAAARAQYGALQAAIAGTPRDRQSTNTIATGRSTTPTTQNGANSVYNDLKVTAAGVAAQIASLQSKHDSLSALVTTGTTALPAQEAELRSLEMNLASANNAYSGVYNAYQAASANSAFGATEMTSIDHAGVPLYPDRPLRYLFLLVGAAAGVIAGVGLAAWQEARRPVTPRVFIKSASGAHI